MKPMKPMKPATHFVPPFLKINSKNKNKDNLQGKKFPLKISTVTTPQIFIHLYFSNP
jgi:hypothetical protein